MTLFNLALKNVQRNMKSYGLYMGSMVFSIIIYFTFVTLQYSDDIQALSSASTSIKGIMRVAAVILLIFVAIFIAYSNAFFLKKRKKEIGLYSLLGVRKQQIGLMLFFENFVMGVVALLIGIVAGFFLSQLFLAVLIRLMGFTIVAQFAFSSTALVQTVSVFLILFLLTSLQGYFVIYRFQLVELFRAAQKGEDLPKARMLATIFGVAMLVGAYWLAAQDMLSSQAWRTIGFLQTPVLIVLLTVGGTYLLFHSVIVYVLTKLKNRTSWAWTSLRLMTVSQLLYRIRNNAKTLTIIAILSATTITAGGAVFSLYYTNTKDTQAYLPQTFMWQGERVELAHDELLYYESYEVKEQEVTIGEQTYVLQVMDVATYNTLAALQQKPPITLNEADAALIQPHYDERFTTNPLEQRVQGLDVALTIRTHVQQSIVNVQLAPVILVVPAAHYAAIESAPLPYNVVKMEDEKNQLAFSEALQEQLGQATMLSSYPEVYAQGLQAYGALLFVGTFLGLVFLVATGSIIYFKMMTEAEEDRDKYAVLSKIGVNEREMDKTIRAQIGIVFAVPLLAGLLHSAFALQAFANLFMFHILQPVLIWMVAYIVIYAVYYVITVTYFKKTIRS